MKIKVGIVEDDRAARENWVKILNAHPLPGAQLPSILDELHLKRVA